MRPSNTEKPMHHGIDQEVLRRLRNLIGRNCAYLGRRCLIIDVVSEEGALILETREGPPPIQVDQYGQPTNRANELLQVPIYGSGESWYSEEILDLFASLDEDRENNKSASE
jgi:hypothetical protein